MTAKLTFTATVQGVKVSVAKGAYDNGSAFADLTFRVSSPQKPQAPSRESWRSNQAREDIRHLSAKSELSENEQARLLEAREDLANADRDYAERRQAYAQQLQAIGPQLMAYAQVAGLVAIFGGMPVTLTLEPAMQDLLPGLEVMMLAPPDDGEMES